MTLETPAANDSLRPRLAAAGLLAAAFGWIEAAVVVYLRRLYYPGGFAFPLRPIDPALLRVELAREAATLMLLAAAAWLAGRRPGERFGWFLALFGVWDLAYYAGLKIALDWPAGWGEWDILFLLPLPWVAPWWTAAVIALLMAVVGIAAVGAAARGRRPRADRATWMLAAAGTAVVLWTFMRDLDAGLGRTLPDRFPVAAYLGGVAALAAAAVRWLRAARPEAS